MRRNGVKLEFSSGNARIQILHLGTNRNPLTLGRSWPGCGRSRDFARSGAPVARWC